METNACSYNYNDHHIFIETNMYVINDHCLHGNQHMLLIMIIMSPWKPTHVLMIIMSPWKPTYVINDHYVSMETNICY